MEVETKNVVPLELHSSMASQSAESSDGKEDTIVKKKVKVNKK